MYVDTLRLSSYILAPADAARAGSAKTLTGDLSLSLGSAELELRSKVAVVSPPDVGGVKPVDMASGKVRRW